MPRASSILSLLLLVSLALAAGCSDTTKYQAEMRGSWALQSRQVPSGETIEAPAISGRIEWFPTAQKQAHVYVAISDDKNAIQVQNSILNIDEDSFTMRSDLRIGGTLGSPTEASFETAPETTTGKITSDDARVTFLFDNGARYEFIGAQLTITHSNGVEDVFKRLKDQKGTLAN